MLGHALGGLLNDKRLAEAVTDFAALRIERHQMTPLLGHMLAPRDNFTAYDAAYVVLAKGLDAVLVSADAKMRAARAFGATVRIVPHGRDV